MLILAGIVINLTIGENGLFKIAKKAAKNYTNVEAKELSNLNNTTNIVEQEINNETEENGDTQIPTDTIDVNLLKAGDYIKYNSGVNGEILCRVLYPVSSEYGLQIISDRSVKNVTLGSKIYSEAVESYNNAIETLNNEAENYINTDYAYDARCVGSLPTVANGMFSLKDNGATTYVTPQFVNANYINSLDEDENYITDQTQMELLGVLKTGEKYWMASRSVYSYTYNCGFFVRVVNDNGNLNGDGGFQVYTSSEYSNSSECGLRICMSMKTSIIKIVSGDGKSADTAYVIGK